MGTKQYTYFGLLVRVIEKLHYYSLVERNGHEFVIPSEDLVEVA